MNNKKPFCYLPWTNIGINGNGRIKPCCRFTPSEIIDDSGVEMNIKTHSIDEYKDSKFMVRTKEQLLNNEWPAGCTRCQYEEEAGIQSKRQLDDQIHAKHTENYDLYSGEFIISNIALGTTCNLKCITCGPNVSSAWRKEWNSIYSTSYADFRVTRHNFVEEFTRHAPNLVSLDVTGGDPFLNEIDQLKDIMRFHIETGNAKTMRIHLTTNTTIFPDESLWELLLQFNQTEIQLSIDGTGKQFEYLRYPAKWFDCLMNIKQFLEAEKAHDNLSLSVSYTSSAYNAYYMDDFYDWTQQIGLPKPYMGTVFEPAQLRLAVWPESIKAKIAARLQQSKYPEVRAWADVILSVTEDAELFEEFLEFTRTHDTYRNNDYRVVFPEMAEMLKEIDRLDDILPKV